MAFSSLACIAILVDLYVLNLVTLKPFLPIHHNTGLEVERGDESLKQDLNLLQQIHPKT